MANPGPWIKPELPAFQTGGRGKLNNAITRSLQKASQPSPSSPFQTASHSAAVCVSAGETKHHPPPHPSPHPHLAAAATAAATRSLPRGKLRTLPLHPLVLRRRSPASASRIGCRVGGGGGRGGGGRRGWRGRSARRGPILAAVAPDHAAIAPAPADLPVSRRKFWWRRLVPRACCWSQ